MGSIRYPFFMPYETVLKALTVVLFDFRHVLDEGIYETSEEIYLNRCLR